MVVKKGIISCCNIVAPPLAVYLLTGAREDLFINSALLLLGVFPSHLHGAYISWTYFRRKKKIRKGVYPGKRRPMIYSEKVQNGGATSEEVRHLKREKETKKKDGGRIRRFLRRVMHREKKVDPIADNSSDGYYEDLEYGPTAPISRRESARVGTDTPQISRRPTQRRSPSYVLDTEITPHQSRRQASLRRHSRRNSMDYANQEAVPGRHTSVRNPQMRIENTEYGPEVVRRQTIQGRSSSGRRQSGRNSDAFADYVSRPALPSRPGSGWREDVNLWRQSVPVAAY